jgi:hypothetical protein
MSVLRFWRDLTFQYPCSRNTQSNATQNSPNNHANKPPLSYALSAFAGLLRWLTPDWSAPPLLVAMDATPLRNRWIILTISGLDKKRAIPVAWDKPAWSPIWAQRWRALAPASAWRAGVGVDRSGLVCA